MPCRWLEEGDVPLDCKEIQPVHPEGDQPWDFFGRNDAKAETPAGYGDSVGPWTHSWRPQLEKGGSQGPSIRKHWEGPRFQAGLTD